MISVCAKKYFLVLIAGLAMLSPAIAQQDQLPQGGGQFVPNQQKRAKLHTELGAMYFQDGNMAVALEELSIALEADSNYATAYNVRGLVYAFLKERAKAEEDFRRAMQLAPNDPEVNNNYGWFLCQNGKERQSITYFLNALKNPLYSTPDRAYTNAGSCALRAGDMEGAESYLRQALRLAPEGAVSARLQLANLNFQRGNLDEARRLIGEVLKLMDPASAEALWLALRIDRKLGNRQSESNYAAQLRSRYPGSQEYQEFLKGNFE